MLRLIVGLAVAVVGCGEWPRFDAASVEATPTKAEPAADGPTGTLTGYVRWSGPLPEVPPLAVTAIVNGVAVHQPVPNPNAPRIDAATRAVAGVVVFLDRVDPAAVPAWKGKPVRVELRDGRAQLFEDGQPVWPAAFVAAGDSVEVVSHEPKPQSLRGRGASTFTLTLPEAGLARRHALHRPGLVRLTSGSFGLGIGGFLFVTDHPYITRTDAAGRFELPDVPPGEYELTAWLPDWQIVRAERDPEMLWVARLIYRAQFELRQRVRVPAGAATATDFALTAATPPGE